MPKLRRPRPKQLLESLRIWLLTWPGFGTCAIGTAVAGIAIYWCTAESRLAEARRNALPAADQARLKDALDKRRGALLPADVARVIEELRGQRALLLPAVTWVLKHADSRSYPATVALAADLGMEETVPLLAESVLAPRALHRGDAVRALDRLQPLGDAQLVDLLADDDPVVAIAAADAVRHREPPSLPLLRAALQRLTDSRETVRAAVLGALPAELPAALAEDVQRLLLDANAADAAARLLPRLPASESNAASLVSQLAGMKPEAQQQLLRDLGKQAALPAMREALWQLADSNASVEVRSAALNALERAGDPGKPASLTDPWPPILRCQAARMRVGTGHLDGVDQLLSLVDCTDREAAGQARVLLAQLAHQPPHSEVSVFQQWRAGIEQLEPADLPPAAPPARPDR